MKFPSLKVPRLRIPLGRVPFLKGIAGREELLGVDIGTTSIKMVEMSPTGADAFRLSNYVYLETFGYLERANSALQTSSLALLESETALHLKTAFSRGGFRTNAATASLPAFSAFTTLVELPPLPDAEISKVMSLQAKQYVPLPISQVTIDWVRVGERTDDRGVKKFQILLIAVVNEQINRYQKIFEMAGLKLATLEIEGVSLARALTRNVETPALIIDIGSRSTGFVVADHGGFKFGGQTDFSGGSITQTIATSLNINIRRAEDLKRQKGLSGYGGDQELSTLMEPILDVIINEAKRVKNNYETSYGGKVERVILSGGGANLFGVQEYFSDQLKLPIEKANPFSGIEIASTLEPLMKDLGPLFAVAIGLALKG